MLLVIFGAGASFDSVAEFPASSRTHMDVRPPLANGLFGTRPIFKAAAKLFPACQPIVQDLRDIPSNTTIEQALTRIQNDSEVYPRAKQQLTAVRYYLHHALWQCEALWGHEHAGVNNYKALLNKIDRWRRQESVLIVTFNYDTMIEDAMTGFCPGFRFENNSLNGGFEDYVGHQEYKLIKLHGSVNWAHYVIKPGLTHHAKVYNDVIAHASELQVSDSFYYVGSGPGRVMTCDEAGRIICPAIAIPVENKGDFECPKEHVNAMIEALPSVTRILTIGWRATETNFLELLRKHLRPIPKLMIVAHDGGEALNIGNHLVGGAVHHGIVPASAGFTEALKNGEIEAFLRT